jgi:ribosomal protein L21
LDEAGKIILEQKVAMTPEAMKQTRFRKRRSLIALETGTHLPVGQPAVNGAGIQSNRGARAKVQLIRKSNRKTIDTTRGHWHGWRESIRSCWAGGIAARRRNPLTVIPCVRVPNWCVLERPW